MRVSVTSWTFHISLAPYYAVKGYFESIHQGLFRLACLGLSFHKNQHDPNGHYTFDSERDSPQSELCREGGSKGRDCITVRFKIRLVFMHMSHPFADTNELETLVRSHAGEELFLLLEK